MHETASTSVLIVGAGPAGLTLACDLARRNVPHRIIETLTAPSESSRAKGVQPRTMEVFDDLGVVDDVIAAGGNYPPFRAHFGPLAVPAGRLNRIALSSNATPYPNLWMIAQWRTEAILRARLEALGGHVEHGATLKSFEQDNDVVRATIETDRGAEIVHAKYLVGADGGRSRVRAILGVTLHGEDMNEPPCIVADLEIENLDRKFWHAWPLAKSCVMTLCPLPHANVFQMQAPLKRGVAIPDLSELGIRDFVRVAIGDRFRVTAVRGSSNHRPHVHLADRFRVGRAFLIGDAAHVHPPSGGQGLNTGVQDAYNLGWKLDRVLDGAPNALLETYESERRPIAASVLGLSKKLYGKAAKRGRDTQQLDLNYRDGTLSREERARPGRVRAGDRAPDALGDDARRLFDVFRGPHFTVLVFDRDASVIAACEHSGAVCVTAPRDAYATYDAAPGSIAVVRPDGYIGLWCNDANAVAQYLRN